MERKRERGLVEGEGGGAENERVGVALKRGKE
jgi:hypothetical protein